MSLAPHHYLTETPEERLEKEVFHYHETLKEDETGRLHDELGRFATDKPETSALSTWQALKEWAELLGLASIEFKEKRPEERFGVYVPYIHIGKTTYFLLAFGAFETIRYFLK